MSGTITVTSPSAGDLQPGDQIMVDGEKYFVGSVKAKTVTILTWRERVLLIIRRVIFLVLAGTALIAAAVAWAP